jgi:hypothetical protein
VAQSVALSSNPSIAKKKKKKKYGWTWWCTPIIPALEGLRQEDYRLEANWATRQDLVSKKTRQK